MTISKRSTTPTPRLRVEPQCHVESSCERAVEAANAREQLDRDEDPVDAVLCAYVALYR